VSKHYYNDCYRSTQPMKYADVIMNHDSESIYLYNQHLFPLAYV
jgi:hypothetical protein